MKQNSKPQRPHFVDEDTEVVYVSVDSWMESISAPHWAAKYFPGYTFKSVSPDSLKKIIKESTPKDDA